MRAKIVLKVQANFGTDSESNIDCRPVVVTGAKALLPPGIVPNSRCTFYLQVPESAVDDGKRLRSLGTGDLNEALAVFRQTKARFDAGMRPLFAESPIVADFRANAEQTNGSPTWAQLHTAFLADLEKGDTKGNTRYKYTRRLSYLNDFLTKRRIVHLSEIHDDLMKDYLVSRKNSIQRSWDKKGNLDQDGKPVKGSNGHSDAKLAKRIFQYAVKKGWMKDNPVEMPANKKGEGSAPFSDDELAAMAKCAGDDALVFWLAYRTGMRAVDLVDLRWSNVDFKEGEITKTAIKNGRRLQIPMVAPLPEMLRQEFESRKPEMNHTILTNRVTKGPMLYDALLDTVKALGSRAGVKSYSMKNRGAHPHRFRDSFALWALERGCAMDEVAQLLGDTLKTVVDHYTPWVKSRQKRMATKLHASESEVDRLLAAAG